MFPRVAEINIVGVRPLVGLRVVVHEPIRLRTPVATKSTTGEEDREVRGIPFTVEVRLGTKGKDTSPRSLTRTKLHHPS